MGHAFSMQLIDGDGVFNVSVLDNFMKEVKLGECGLSYAVVSIMGPQSSGMGSLLSIVSILFTGCFLLSDCTVFLVSCREEYAFESSFSHQF
jgi:hypothetical protein